MMAEDEPTGEEGEALHRSCRRCRRRLKNPKAMKAGYGKVCAKKIREI